MTNDQSVDRESGSASGSKPSVLWRTLWLFVLGLLIAFSLGIRNDPALHFVATEKILRLEHSSGISLRPLKYLFSIDIDPTVDELFSAIERTDVATLGFLLDAGFSANSQLHSRSALRAAVEMGYPEPVAILAARGAQIDFVDDTGMTPLLGAIAKNNVDMVNLLLTLRANPNAAAGEGKTPLIMAIASENVPIVDLLLEKLVNVNLPSKDGKTPLIVAVEKGNTQIIDRILAKGGNVNAQDGEGNSALIYAVKRDDLSIINRLAARNVTFGLRNKSGVTARDLAQSEKTRLALEKLEGVIRSDIPSTSGQQTTSIVVRPAEEPIEPAIEESFPPAATPTPVQPLPTAATPPRPRRTATPTPTEPSGVKMTRLRLVGKVEALWDFQQKTTLRSVRLRVRNVGDYPAEGVNIKVRIAGGTEILLEGPSRLERNDIGNYTAAPSAAATGIDDPKEILTCSNCFR